MCCCIAQVQGQTFIRVRRKIMVELDLALMCNTAVQCKHYIAPTFFEDCHATWSCKTRTQRVRISRSGVANLSILSTLMDMGQSLSRSTGLQDRPQRSDFDGKDMERNLAIALNDKVQCHIVINWERDVPPVESVQSSPIHAGNFEIWFDCTKQVIEKGKRIL